MECGNGRHSYWLFGCRDEGKLIATRVLSFYNELSNIDGARSQWRVAVMDVLIRSTR